MLREIIARTSSIENPSTSITESTRPGRTTAGSRSATAFVVSTIHRTPLRCTAWSTSSKTIVLSIRSISSTINMSGRTSVTRSVGDICTNSFDGSPSPTFPGSFGLGAVLSTACKKALASYEITRHPRSAATTRAAYDFPAPGNPFRSTVRAAWVSPMMVVAVVAPPLAPSTCCSCSSRAW